MEPRNPEGKNNFFYGFKRSEGINRKEVTFFNPDMCERCTRVAKEGPIVIPKYEKTERKIRDKNLINFKQEVSKLYKRSQGMVVGS